MALGRNVLITKSNQYLLTIPKALAETLNFNSKTILDLTLDKGFNITLIKAKAISNSLSIKIQQNSNSQFIITIPKPIAELVGYHKNQKINIVLDSKQNIMLTR